MTLMRKFAMVGAAAVAALMLVSAIAVTTAQAQAALPYKAYGPGLKAGQVENADGYTQGYRNLCGQCHSQGN